MKNYLKVDPWCIIEEGFDPENVKSSESIFSLGNGKMGQRANFEEHYSGQSLLGNYFAGIFYPDKTKVGWWKIGYPEYFGKMINSVNWVGIDVFIDHEVLNLAKCKVKEFKRVLNMREGSLIRTFVAEIDNSGKLIKVESVRFISMANTSLAAISYSVTPVNFDGIITVIPYLDGDVINCDANYEEKFWLEEKTLPEKHLSVLQVRTNKLDYHVCSSMKNVFFLNNKEILVDADYILREKYIAEKYNVDVEEGQKLTIFKYVVNVTSLDVEPEIMASTVEEIILSAEKEGFDKLFEAHKKVWETKWEMSDIIIEGDVKAQQAVRFNIFQLNQTYTGDDERLNIGPKGFTGEKYGGGTYWDTEAFCFPFYLNTSDPKVARNLLLYRYRQLGKAIENALKLGFTGGAALYPMVTVNGEECHNEWEITFEEIHRNGAIAYAIFNYVKHTQDEKYLADFGLETLVALSRFWAQRTTYSKLKEKYVILGVTGPNEYENNVNNNWYTNYIGTWTLKYTLQIIEMVKNKYPDQYKSVVEKTKFKKQETVKWNDIISKMYFPLIEGTNIFLQQEGYLDKEQLTIADIPPEHRPLNQHWSWDRILRSVFIKQADVLQGIYFFMDDFSVDAIRENYNFYEPKTVHESSLSSSIYSVVASNLGEIDNAYNLYLRTSRMDLDDYNNEVSQGLHITSMAGSWLSIVEGFARKRISNGMLAFSPLIPAQWTSFSFKIKFRQHILEVFITKNEVKIRNIHNDPIDILLYGLQFKIGPNGVLGYQKPDEK